MNQHSCYMLEKFDGVHQTKKKQFGKYLAVPGGGGQNGDTNGDSNGDSHRTHAVSDL